MGQQEQGGLVGPVQVVEDEQRRPLGGQAADEAVQRPEQPVPRALGVVERARGPALLAEERAQVRRQLAPGHSPAQGLDERLVGHERLLPAAPVEDVGAAAVDGAGQLEGQTGLPDPGLAGDQREAALAPGRRVPGVAQTAALLAASLEVAARRAQERGRKRKRPGCRAPGGLRRPRGRGEVPGAHPTRRAPGSGRTGPCPARRRGARAAARTRRAPRSGRRGGQAPDQGAGRLLGQRVQRGALARELSGLARPALGLPARRHGLDQLAGPGRAARRAPPRPTPRPARAAARRGGAGRGPPPAGLRRQGVGLGAVHPDRLAVEPEALARGDEDSVRGPQGATQLRQGGAQARAARSRLARRARSGPRPRSGDASPDSAPATPGAPGRGVRAGLEGCPVPLQLQVSEQPQTQHGRKRRRANDFRTGFSRAASAARAVGGQAARHDQRRHDRGPRPGRRALGPPALAPRPAGAAGRPRLRPAVDGTGHVAARRRRLRRGDRVAGLLPLERPDGHVGRGPGALAPPGGVLPRGGEWSATASSAAASCSCPTPCAAWPWARSACSP